VNSHRHFAIAFSSQELHPVFRIDARYVFIASFTSTSERGACIGEIMPKQVGPIGLAVQPRRWVVECFFAWLGRNRRLA